MLYKTTREEGEHFPAQQVLTEDRGPDGGLFLPFQMPHYTREDLLELGKLPFTARITQMLNSLCDTDLTQWDVDFCVERRPVRLVGLPQKIQLAQCWHNIQGSMEHLVRTLASRVRRDGRAESTDWLQIAVRISVLFALLTEPEISRLGPVDVAFPAGQLYGPVSAVYAHSWGLPIGNILLCCNENGQLWELFHRGQLRTDAVSVATQTPDADVTLPVGLERLLYEAAGAREVARFLDCCRQGGVYAPGDEVLDQLRHGMFVSVVGAQRMEDTISGIWSMAGIVLSPYDALCHAGISDYRAKTGRNHPAVLFSEKSPLRDRLVTAAALGLPAEDLENALLGKQD